MTEVRWFYRDAAEWKALVERLKLTVCPHCQRVGMLIQHGSLFGFDELSPRRKTIRARRRVHPEQPFAAGVIEGDVSSRREIIPPRELARLARVTQPRMTQILKLVFLAPDIQEKILHLHGKVTLSEKLLRPITVEPSWQRQRHLWRELGSVCSLLAAE